MTAKVEEVDWWLRIAAAAGRRDDVVLVGPRHGARINALGYEYHASGSIENFAQLIMTLMEIAEVKAGGGGGGDFKSNFFQRAALELIRNGLTLASLSSPRFTAGTFHNVVSGAPTQARALIELPPPGPGEEGREAALAKLPYFDQCIDYCKAELARTGDDPRRADYDHALAFFMGHWPNLANETRSSILATLTSITDPFNRSPLRELFGKETTFVPELCWERGKVVIHDAPTHRDGDIGLIQQLTHKFLFQKACQRRDTRSNDRPVLLWQDEGQEFILRHHDQQFQCVARSTLCANVVLTQNLSNIHTTLAKKEEADSLISNFRNKFIFSVDDTLSMKECSELLGREKKTFVSGSPGKYDPLDVWGGEPGGFSFSQQLQPRMEPSEFSALRRARRGVAECIQYQAGSAMPDGRTYMRTMLRQWF